MYDFFGNHVTCLLTIDYSYKIAKQVIRSQLIITFKPGTRCSPDFLKSFCLRTLVYVCVCVSTPEGINNKSRERHSFNNRIIKAFPFLYITLPSIN